MFYVPEYIQWTIDESECWGCQVVMGSGYEL